jgi:hypothetical protein
MLSHQAKLMLDEWVIGDMYAHIFLLGMIK